MQDRRDVSSHGGLGQLVSSVSSAGSFPPAPRLSHTPTSDFQPPYFPPPYNLPSQQTMDFHHPHFNADSYSHLSNFHQQSQQHYHQLHPPERNVLRYKEEPLHNMHPGLTPPHSEYGGIRRPDILMSGGHPLGFGDQNTNLLNIHPSAGLPGIEDGIHQVRTSFIFIWFSSRWEISLWSELVFRTGICLEEDAPINCSEIIRLWGSTSVGPIINSPTVGVRLHSIFQIIFILQTVMKCSLSASRLIGYLLERGDIKWSIKFVRFL